MYNFKNFKSKKIPLNSHSKVSSAHKLETWTEASKQKTLQNANIVCTIRFVAEKVCETSFVGDFIWKLTC